MNCNEALLALSAELDGELTPQEAEALRAHLDTCPSCRALREELRGISAACGALEADPPAQLMAGVMDRLPSRDTAKPAARAAHRKRWGALAAAAVLIAVGAFTLPNAARLKSAPQGFAGGSAPMMAADNGAPAPAEDTVRDYPAEIVSSAEEPMAAEEPGGESGSDGTMSLFAAAGGASDLAGAEPSENNAGLESDRRNLLVGGQGDAPQNAAQTFGQDITDTDEVKANASLATSLPPRKPNFEDEQDETPQPHPAVDGELPGTPAEIPEVTEETATVLCLYGGAQLPALAGYSGQVQPDGSVCYFLPLDVFDELAAQAAAGGAPDFQLRAAGEDPSPAPPADVPEPYGVVIVFP